jgi:hypothetical protein
MQSRSTFSSNSILSQMLATSHIGQLSFAVEFEGQKLNRNDELIKHPEATFYARVAPVA